MFCTPLELTAIDAIVDFSICVFIQLEDHFTLALRIDVARERRKKTAKKWSNHLGGQFISMWADDAFKFLVYNIQCSMSSLASSVILSLNHMYEYMTSIPINLCQKQFVIIAIDSKCRLLHIKQWLLGDDGIERSWIPCEFMPPLIRQFTQKCTSELMMVFRLNLLSVCNCSRIFLTNLHHCLL